MFMKVAASHTCFPLCGLSKKQTCVSHSTPEAEIVAAELATRSEGLPGLDLWTFLLNRKVELLFCEDNQASIVIIETGKSPNLRHLGRTHKVDLAWLHETFSDAGFNLGYIKTTDQAADIFTKAFTAPDKWFLARWLIGHVTRKELLAARPEVPEKPLKKPKDVAAGSPVDVAKVGGAVSVCPARGVVAGGCRASGRRNQGRHRPRPLKLCAPCC